MRTIEIDGKKVTVELEWEALKAVDSYSKEVRALVQANPGVKKGVVIKAGGVTVIGLVPPGQKVLAPSAAAWLATANHAENERLRKNEQAEANWIVVERLGEDQYWLCVIKDEVPLPGSDVVDNWEGTAQRISDLVTIGGFIVYSNDEDVQSYVSEASPAQNKSFTALIQGVKSRSRVRVISGVSPSILIGVGTVVLLGAGWWAYSTYASNALQHEAQLKAQQQQQQQALIAAKAAAEYDRLRRNAVSNALAEVKEDLHRSLSTPSSTDLVSAWADLIDKIPLSHDGWLMDKLSCSLGADLVPVCNVHLRRSDWGINRTLAEDFPTVQFSGDTASYDVRSDKPLVARNNDLSSVPKVRAFGVNELSNLQEVKAGGVTHSVEASTDIVKQVILPAKPGPGGAAPAPAAPGAPSNTPTMPPIQLGVATGALFVTGDKLWQIRDIGPILDSSAIVVQNITVSIGQEITGGWKLGAQYYVKTLDQPIVPELPAVSTGPKVPGAPGTIMPVPTAALGTPAPAPTPVATSNGLPANAGTSPAPALSNSTVQGSVTGAPPPPPPPATGVPRFQYQGPNGDGNVPPMNPPAPPPGAQPIR